MINIKRLTENLTEMKENALLEDTFRSLKDQVDSGRKRSTTNAKFVGIDQAKDGAARTHWKVPSESKPGKSYDVVVEIVIPEKGGLFAVAASPWNLKAHAQTLAKADVRVHCSCPDFYWSGMKYNLGPNGPHKGSLAHDQKSDVSEETYPIKPPDIRDPNRENVMCKHLSKVWRSFATSGTTIMSQARKYSKENEIIPVDSTVTRDSDDGKAILNKDVEGVSVTEGDARHITDSLFTSVKNFVIDKVSGLKKLWNNKEDVVDTTDDEFDDQGADEFIDEENQDIESIEDEIEEVKDQGAEDIIDDTNDTVDADESDIKADAILSEPENEPENEPESGETLDELDNEYSAKDILSR